MHEHEIEIEIKNKLKKKRPTAGMKPSPSSSLYNQQQEMEEGVLLAVGMDVDDTDPFDFLGEIDRPPLDADFFNAFQDDFDDDDIN